MEYSVIIRTLGKAGYKYQQLLKSIDSSDITPKDVIVVLPEGYDKPKEQLGYEQFIFSPKGMVAQRMEGINQCKTKYALIIDDDIAFEQDFVTKVSAPVINGKYGLSSGPLLSFFPQKGKQTVINAVLGQSVPTVFHKTRYNTVLKTTGYSYNRNIEDGKLYETQSAPWTCFFANIEKLKSICFDDEIWLDLNGYSAYDDTTMFYKAWLNGIKSVIVADANYQHLDAGSSRVGINTKYYFSRGFNSYILWKRLICNNSGKIKESFKYIPFRYHELVMRAFYRIKHGKECSIAFHSGYCSARKWAKGEEYRNLPSVCCQRNQ